MVLLCVYGLTVPFLPFFVPLNGKRLKAYKLYFQNFLTMQLLDIFCHKEDPSGNWSTEGKEKPLCSVSNHTSGSSSIHGSHCGHQDASPVSVMPTEAATAAPAVLVA